MPRALSPTFRRVLLFGLLVCSAAGGVRAELAELRSEESRHDEPAPDAPVVGDATSPRLVVSPPEYDWGRVYRGEQLSRTFVIENTGGSRLEIVELKPACGCTLIDEADLKKSLEPGEKTKVTVKMDTSGFRGDVEKYTEIVSNSIGTSNKLVMRGHVAELLRLEPDAPVVEVICGAPTTVTATHVKVTPADGKPLRILSIKAAQKKLRARHRQDEDGLIHLELTPVLTAESRPGIEMEHLITELVAGGAKYTLHVPITIALRPRIGLEPLKSVYFRRKTTEKNLGGEDPAAEITKELTLISHGDPDHRFEVTGVSSGKGFFGTALETVTPGRAYRLTVTVDHRPEEGVRFVKDIIEVRTDDPLVPVLKIPVRAQF